MATKIESRSQPVFAKPWYGTIVPKCVQQKPLPEGSPTLPSNFQRTIVDPWKRILGYDDTEIAPLPRLPVTNFYKSPVFIPKGMSTDPIHYPNLVTGFERSPQHAARASLDVRYTDKDWVRGCTALYNEAKKTRINCENVRAEAIRLMRETDEKTTLGQTDVKYRIKERMKDMRFWRDELNKELENIKAESLLLSGMKTNISQSLQDLEAPLHIAQECIHLREGRRGIDKERDFIEESLLREVDNLHNSRNKFGELHHTIDQQLSELRNAQHALEEDVVHKDQTLCIDRICKDLDNFSRGISYRGGIEKTASATTTAESWNEAIARRVNISQAARAKAAELRISLGTLVTSIAVSIQEHFVNTDWAFDRGQVKLSNEITKIQHHLGAIKEERFQLDKYVSLIKKALGDKTRPLMLSQTRLEARCHREGLELCEDFAHRRLIKEVSEIQDSIEKLYEKLTEAESKYDQLLKTRYNLEKDLKQKVNSLFTDREKCMSLRRSFPINKMIKY